TQAMSRRWDNASGAFTWALNWAKGRAIQCDIRPSGPQSARWRGPPSSCGLVVVLGLELRRSCEPVGYVIVALPAVWEGLDISVLAHGRVM
ncbi:MAG: hypothetical protein ACK441_12915, partial [Burkholderiales bacterium]